MISTRATSIAFVGALLVTGCAEDPAPADWSLRLARPELAERIAIIEASIFETGCDGRVLVYRVEIAKHERGPRPPRLDPGLYGFAAAARDESCRTVARGCAEVRLPARGRGRVEVLLDSVDEGPACVVGACAGGRCGRSARDADGGIALDDGGGPDDPDHRSEDDGGVDDGGRADAWAFTPADAGASAPPGCDAFVGGHCYMLERDQRTWPDAELACVAWGGHLVSLASPEEELIVAAMAEAVTDRFWIGLSDLGEEGTWLWAGGDGSDHRAWSRGEPNDGGSGEDCAEARTDGSGWADRACRQSKSYVCER